MKRFKKILVATDCRLRHHPIVEEAADIALQNEATLRIVDVVPEFSWFAKMSVDQPKHMIKLLQEEKQEKLEQIADPLREKGVDASTKVLTGKTSVEIIREALLCKNDLVMRIAKGLDSHRKGTFGTTGLSLLRKCPCPVWLVSRNASPEFKRVVGCIDVSSGHDWDEEVNQQVFDLGTSISEYHSGKFSLVHAWSFYGEQLMKSRLSEAELAALIDANRDQARTLLDRFLSKQETQIPAENVHLIKGSPLQLIPDFLRGEDADLVVMGTVARSGVAGMIMGNTAEQILSEVDCSVLAVKPNDFQCPIKLA